MFFKWDKERSDGIKHYDAQSEIIKKALEKNSLEELLKLMREDREEAAIYLSGTRLDNQFLIEILRKVNIEHKTAEKIEISDCYSRFVTFALYWIYQHEG
jgi:hypothetical protein